MATTFDDCADVAARLGLIRRSFRKGDAESDAIYSPCDGYRYALTRIWNPGAARLLYVMLNPSKATEVQNDPTVERCERRARALGYGGFRVCNIFAWRETDPKALRRARDPVGPANDAVLRESATEWIGGGLVLCGWGAHGDHMNRGAAAQALLRATGAPLAHLGLTRAGQPRHPLYIAYATQPEAWPGTIR